MPRLNPDNLQRAHDLIAVYPEARSALIPILHVLQEQDGYLTEDGMTHVGELLGLEAVEVRGTASFYDMFHFEPVGKYLVAVCTNIACMLQGAYRLLEHVEERLGVAPGGTTADGMFTLEDAECLALCGNAPCLTVNWRFFGDIDPDGFDTLVDDLRNGRLDEEVPPHGTLSRVRRTVGLTAPAAGTVAAADDRADHAALSGAAPTYSGAAPAGTTTTAPARTAGPAGDDAPAARAAAAIDLSTRRTTTATRVMDAGHLEGA
ncbi:MAG TPA: NAD(P)H-dependent oxidoreductase subunit E [Acidimicrobiales bacterium]|nr:NAD(P)H-dependent oxidoreductase subunit E [Acidimicrobiales bacterium]